VNGTDCIYHLAAGTSGSHFEMMLNTVVATNNLIESLAVYRPKRFVLVSTFSAYKLTTLRPGSVLDETCPLETDLKSRDSYTVTKVRQEILVRKRCNEMGIPLVVVRPGKVYGPGSDPIPPQLGLNIPGICFLFIGGESLIPLTHVTNCAEAIFLAGVVDSAAGKVYNIVDDDLPTQKQYRRLYENNLGKIHMRIPVPYRLFKLLALGLEGAAKLTRGNIPPVISRYRAENLWKELRYDNSKAKRELKWSPRIPIQQGITEMLSYASDGPRLG